MKIGKFNKNQAQNIKGCCFSGNQKMLEQGEDLREIQKLLGIKLFRLLKFIIM